MSTRRRSGGSGAGMRVPPVLPHLRIQISADGDLRVRLDRQAYDIPCHWRGADAVPTILEQVTRGHGPVRLEIVEADGTLFTDIITPPAPERPEAEPPDAAPTKPTRAAELRGRAPFEAGGEGYLPEEPVAIAVVVGEYAAGPDGTARLHLPPALWSRHGPLVLLGRTSGTSTILQAEGTGRTG